MKSELKSDNNIYKQNITITNSNIFIYCTWTRGIKHKILQQMFSMGKLRQWQYFHTEHDFLFDNERWAAVYDM